jgi:transcriptional regulator with XRE-family HTH domain
MPEPWLLGPYIGARVRELRGQRGVSLPSVAQRARLTLQALADLEAGEVPDVPVSVLCALAQALRVKPSTLLPERPATGARKRKEATH